MKNFLQYNKDKIISFKSKYKNLKRDKLMKENKK